MYIYFPVVSNVYVHVHLAFLATNMFLENCLTKFFKTGTKPATGNLPAAPGELKGKTCNVLVKK